METTQHEKMNVPSDNPITETENGKTYTNVLRVKSDPPGTTDEDRKKNVKKLAGAIAHNIRRFGEVHVRAVGKESVYKAIKAIIEARGMVAVHGHDLYVSPGYMVIGNLEDKTEMTGMSFYVITSTSTSNGSQTN
jgi:stage V sporulation protein SpoVS